MIDLIIILGCCVSVATLLTAEATSNTALKWAAKPAASILFIILAIHSGALETGFGRIVLGGLVFCALGDVLLIRRQEVFFLAGMGAFAVGHMLYAGAFLTRDPAWSMTASIITALMGITGVLFLRLMWKCLGSFRMPVLAYIIIGAMVIASATVFSTPAGVGPSWQFMIAALAFAISDIAVARDQFLEQSLVNKIWGLPLYYGAQLLFASSV